jgi:adenosylcobinamide-phosphate synthase
VTWAPVAAVVIDRALGEPPVRLHPVVWMGAYCTWAGTRMRAVTRPRAQVAVGAIATAAGAALAGVAATTVRGCLRRLPRVPAVLIEGAVLSTLLSARMLEREVVAVERALAGGDLAAGRRAVARLVSRDVTALAWVQVREAALESLAENTSDSIVAPLWWYALAGLPGAAVYRFVNTADAMWAYRDEVWVWRGRVTAIADDVANWWPARLTALLLAPRAFTSRAGAVRAAVTAAVTTSPNAGWPMGALALRLGVRLGKTGVYTLHPHGRPARAADTARAVRAARWATAVAAAGAALATAART